MKNGSIALLFQRHEAKAKKIDVGSGIGSNQTPFVCDGSGSGSAVVVDDASSLDSNPVVDDASGSDLKTIVQLKFFC